MYVYIMTFSKYMKTSFDEFESETYLDELKIKIKREFAIIIDETTVFDRYIKNYMLAN